MMPHNRFGAAFLLAGLLALSGCETAGTMQSLKSSDRISGAMASAADDAAKNGMASESLVLNEKLYNGNPNNPDYILAYARNLRRAGRIDDAILVIRTPALEKDASEPLITECAMVLVASGDYEEAYKFADKAVSKKLKSPDAHHVLALALSGLGKHAEAQAEFQRALDLWQKGRDKTAIINNLAMSQVAQGKILEARSTMALATGEALKSEVYQNNRAFLSAIEDRPVAEPLSDVVLEPTMPEDHAAADGHKLDSDLLIKLKSRKPGTDIEQTQTAAVKKSVPEEDAGNAVIAPEKPAQPQRIVAKEKMQPILDPEKDATQGATPAPVPEVPPQAAIKNSVKAQPHSKMQPISDR